MTFPTDLNERNEYILNKIRSRDFDHIWAPIVSGYNGHFATFYVSSDAIKIEGVRINVSAYLQQQIADILGASLLTAKIADLLHSQADIIIEPLTRPITSSTIAMIDQSEKIDTQLNKLYPNKDLSGKLISSTGKHWILNNVLNPNKITACNYGWFVNTSGTQWKGVPVYPCASLTKNPQTGAYYRLIQQPSTQHDFSHVDYSQICILLMNLCEVDGNQMLLGDVLTNKELAPLASHEGIMNILRQPQVPIVHPNN